MHIARDKVRLGVLLAAFIGALLLFGSTFAPTHRAEATSPLRNGVGCTDVYFDPSLTLAPKSTNLGLPPKANSLLVGKSLSRTDVTDSGLPTFSVDSIATKTYLGEEIEGFEPNQTTFDLNPLVPGSTETEIIPDLSPTNWPCVDPQNPGGGKPTWQVFSDQGIDLDASINNTTTTVVIDRNLMPNKLEKLLTTADDIRIDNEQMDITAILANTPSAGKDTLTVVRGTKIGGKITAAVAHNNVSATNRKAVLKKIQGESKNTQANSFAEVGTDLKAKATATANNLIPSNIDYGVQGPNVLRTSSCYFDGNFGWVKQMTNLVVLNKGAKGVNFGEAVLFLGVDQPSGPTVDLSKPADGKPDAAADPDDCDESTGTAFPATIVSGNREPSTDCSTKVADNVVTDPSGGGVVGCVVPMPQPPDTADGLADDQDGDGCTDWDELSIPPNSGRDPFNPNDCKHNPAGIYNILASVQAAIPGSAESKPDGECAGIADDDGDTFINDGCPRFGPNEGVAFGESGGQCSNGITDDGDARVNDGCPTQGGAPEVAATECNDAINDDPGDDAFINDGCPAFAGNGEQKTQCASGDIVDNDGDTRVNDGCPAVLTDSGVTTGTYFHCIARLNKSGAGPVFAILGRAVCYQDSAGLSSGNTPPPVDEDGISGPPPPPPYGLQPPSAVAGFWDEGSNILTLRACFKEVATLGLRPAVVADVTGVNSKTGKGGVDIYGGASNATCDALSTGAPAALILSADISLIRQNIDFDHDNDGCTDFDELEVPQTNKCGDDPYNPHDGPKKAADLSGVYTSVAKVVGQENPQPGNATYFSCRNTLIHNTGTDALTGQIFCYTDAQAIVINNEVPGVFSDGYNGAPPPFPFGEVPQQILAEAGTLCTNNTDDDYAADGRVNDGCPAAGPDINPPVGPDPESGAQCTNATSDEAGAKADAVVNDGCPAVSGPADAHTALAGTYNTGTNHTEFLFCFKDTEAGDVPGNSASLGNVIARADVDAHTGIGTVDVFVFQTKANCNALTPGSPQPLQPEFDNVPLLTTRQSNDFSLDSDEDGCMDSEELGNNPLAGGLRDPNNPYDFFDPTADGAIAGGDFFAVLGRFNISGNADILITARPIPAAGYWPTHDRAAAGVPGSNSWNAQKPDGNIAGGDFFQVLGAFNQSCQAAPN